MRQSSSRNVITGLSEALGGAALDVIATDPELIEQHSADASGARGGAALVLLRPTSEEQVRSIVLVAAAHGFPIVPQGSRSGLAGAASTVSDAILIDFSRMNRILRIDPLEQIAVVDPGVIVSDLADAVAREGLFYAPDPVSAERASIGGTVNTNAGGMRCIKYGVTRDSIRSLRIVLADGSVIDTRRDTVKSVAGLDLTSLVVGSEGTLGLVTQVTVSLRSAPGPMRGVSAVFPHLAAALAAANEIATAPVVPAILELLDDVALAAIRQYDSGLGLREDARAWLLAVTDAHVAADEELDAFEVSFTKHGALSTERAGSPRELDRLLAVRRALHPGMQAYLGGSLNGDIVVPRARLAEVVDHVAEIAQSYGLLISMGGHIGDGNFHPVVAYNPSDLEQATRAHAAQAEILRVAQSLGGTITGEHGVGTEKRAALDGELSPRVRELQLAIKAAFDPQGIFNPGSKL